MRHLGWRRCLDTQISPTNCSHVTLTSLVLASAFCKLKLTSLYSLESMPALILKVDFTLTSTTFFPQISTLFSKCDKLKKASSSFSHTATVYTERYIIHWVIFYSRISIMAAKQLTVFYCKAYIPYNTAACFAVFVADCRCDRNASLTNLTV